MLGNVSKQVPALALDAHQWLLVSILQIRGSIVVSISACHAEDPGSIPGRGLVYNAIPPHPIRGSIVVSISACHAKDPGSIPGRGG